jgi:hypothetical protein
MCLYRFKRLPLRAMKMNPTQILAIAGSGLFAISTSCTKQEAAAPIGTVATARIVGIETTVDGDFKHPRPRWTLDLSPIELPGWVGRSYQQVKIFTLPDTAAYKVGRTITFHYRLVPQAQETPWRTFGAWKSLAAYRTGTDALPEIITSDNELVTTKKP